MKKIVLILMILALGMSLFGLTIFEDRLDSQSTILESWKESSSSYVLKYTGSYKIGTASMQLKYNGYATTYINIAPFKNLVLTFKMAKYSLERGEKVVCEYSTNNGSSWVTAATLLNTASSGTFYSYRVNIPNANVLWLRFRIIGSASNDYGYIDNIVLTGDRK